MLAKLLAQLLGIIRLRRSRWLLRLWLLLRLLLRRRPRPPLRRRLRPGRRRRRVRK